MAVEAKVGSGRESNSLIKFLREVKAEFKKITWASRDEVIKRTGVVLVTIILIGLIIWAFDSVFGIILKAILNILK
jgi:preprotein translocase subunit SecE